MINADNYYSKAHSLDFSSLPPALQKGYEFVDKVTMKGESWTAYHDSPTIQKVIDGYFEKVSEYLLEGKEKKPVTPEHREEISKAKQDVKEGIKHGQKQKKQIHKEAKIHVSIEKKEEEDVDLVERIPEELRLMKRYVNLNGKKKTHEELLRFINSLQKAILERRIRKESPYAKQVKYMQDALLKVYNGMKGRSIEIEVNQKTIREFKKEIEGEKIFPSIQLIKRYVNLHGKVGIKEKAKKLYEQMNKAVKKKKIHKNDKYAVKLNEIWLSLKAFLEDKNKKTLPMNSAELNGLLGFLGENAKKLYDTDEKKLKTIKKKGNLIAFKKPFYPRGTSEQGYTQLMVAGIRKEKSGAIKIEGFGRDSDWYNSVNELFDAINWEWMESVHAMDGLDDCNCGLKGIDETPQNGNKIMSSMDFADMKFNSIGFEGKWRDLMGDPAPGFTAMVFGKPKTGKSYLCVEFAGYLARNHGKVLYVAREEGLDATLQIKLNDKNVKHPNLFVSDFLPEGLSEYDFIFLDSVNKLGLSSSDLDMLRKKNPGKSFIFIFQTTKDGNFRGKNEFQHDVDVVIEVAEKGKAIQSGRYNQGGEMSIFE
jgi:predicted transcriptional regulator